MSDAVKAKVQELQNVLGQAQANLDSINAQTASAQQAVDTARDDLAVWTDMDAKVDAEEAAKASGVQTYGDTSATPEQAPADDTPQEAPPVEQAPETEQPQ